MEWIKLKSSLTREGLDASIEYNNPTWVGLKHNVNGHENRYLQGKEGL